MIGKPRGASIYSTCLASPLSTALTAEHVSDSVKGLCIFLPGLMSESSQGSTVSPGSGEQGERGGAVTLKLMCTFMNEINRMFLLK